MRGFALGLLLTASACSDPPPAENAPLDIGPDQVCALDGMLVDAHAGPKAQVLRRDGSRAFFCDAKEAFEETLAPWANRRVAGIWFQNLDRAGWESHPDGWAAADSLYFVGGSTKIGPMGPTLVPFRERSNAESFVAHHGGQIYRYNEIDLGLVKKLKMQGIDAL